MARPVGILGAAALLALCATGCPVTDDYYIESGAGTATGGGSGAENTSGSGGTSGTSAAGTGAIGGSGGDLTVEGGAPGQAGAPGQMGGAGTLPECVAVTERCNGHDDDCDGVTDEFGVCQSGCSGFLLPGETDHGYMFCRQGKDYSHALEACAAQNMHLAWLQSAGENTAMAQQLVALGDVTEVLIGASDRVKEGDWYWEGGALFWRGAQNGRPVGGAFAAWAPGTPDNLSGNDDCGVLNPSTELWSDHTCSASYAYLCEDPD